MAKKVKQSKDNSRLILLFAAVFALIGIVSLTSSYAAKGGKGNNNGATGGSFSWAISPNPAKFNQSVTATLTTNQLPAARITEITCVQNGNTVLSSAKVHKLEDISTASGSYVFTQTTSLATPSWTSGGAECKAELGSLDSKLNFKAISSTSFTVNP